mgnify:CR=1 FL=1|tara:strand:- start:134 stop:343 length:210 start_codon:yes stop_codon:yes gene_type:complete
MIYSDDTQSILRENNLIAENEIALQSGDLILAENVLTKERRMLQKEVVSRFITNTKITESTTKARLLKG